LAAALGERETIETNERDVDVVVGVGVRLGPWKARVVPVPLLLAQLLAPVPLLVGKAFLVHIALVVGHD